MLIKGGKIFHGCSRGILAGVHGFMGVQEFMGVGGILAGVPEQVSRKTSGEITGVMPEKS